MAKTATRANLYTSASITAGTVVRSAVLDCSAVDGGIITAKMTNGATGPTAQGTIRLLFAHKQTSAPTAAAEGTAETDWKIVAEVGAGTAALGYSKLVYSFGPEKAGYFHIEFGQHTVQAVTGEAQASTRIPGTAFCPSASPSCCWPSGSWRWT